MVVFANEAQKWQTNNPDKLRDIPLGQSIPMLCFFKIRMNFQPCLMLTVNKTSVNTNYQGYCLIELLPGICGPYILCRPCYCSWSLDLLNHTVFI